MIREAVLAKIEKAGGIDSYIRSRQYNFCVCRLEHGFFVGEKSVVISKNEKYKSAALLCNQCKRIHKEDFNLLAPLKTELANYLKSYE